MDGRRTRIIDLMPVSDAPHSSQKTQLFDLDTDSPIWDRFFTVAPLVLIGTRESDGKDDLAPKHMVSPIGWQNYFGFVCTPRHATYQNIKRDGVFAVTYPKASQWLQTSLTASPRCDDESKPGLQLVHSHRSPTIDCPVVDDGYLYLECKLDRFVDDFGVNSLIVGKIVTAKIDSAYLRSMDRDDQDILQEGPVLAYLSPGRFAIVKDSFSFPMPKGMKR